MRRTAEEQLHRDQVAELPLIDRLTRVELLLVEGHPFEIPTDLERSARRHIGNRDARTCEVETQFFGACFGHEPPSSASPASLSVVRSAGLTRAIRGGPAHRRAAGEAIARFWVVPPPSRASKLRSGQGR